MSVIEEIVRAARNAGASDVHITVGIPPKMRVNGSLITMSFPRITAKDTVEILLGIMTQAQRERFEEWGECDMAFQTAELGRFRLHAYKQKGLTALVIRLINMQMPSPDALGIPESVMNLYEKDKGLILVTGAAGSGKTTTLAAIIDRINTNREAHIITLEEPVEYIHQHKMAMVNQREIGVDARNYAHALRAAMHEDADVILVGGMHDAETIDAAVAAVETGHLVLAEMNTMSMAGTIEHLIDAFPLSKQKQIGVRLAKVLETIVLQRLQPSANGKMRVAEFEVMNMDDKLRDIIRERKLV